MSRLRQRSQRGSSGGVGQLTACSDQKAVAVRPAGPERWSASRRDLRMPAPAIATGRDDLQNQGQPGAVTFSG